MLFHGVIVYNGLDYHGEVLKDLPFPVFVDWTFFMLFPILCVASVLHLRIVRRKLLVAQLANVGIIGTAE